MNGRTKKADPRCVPDARHVGIQVTCSKYGGATAISYSHSGLDHLSGPPGKAPRPAGQRPQLKRCPPSVRTFTGRNDILAQMRECFFTDSRNQRMFLLYGLGGAGKTQIALKFVEMSQGETVPRWVPHIGHIYICLSYNLACPGSQMSISLMQPRPKP